MHMHGDSGENEKIPNAPTRPVRPFGVTLIGYAYIVLFGIQGIAGAVRVLARPAAREEMLGAYKKVGVDLALSAQSAEAVVTAVLYLQLIFSLAQLVLGIGMLRRQEWSRLVVVYLVLLSAFSALAVALLQPALAPFMVLSLLYPAVVFWYCTKPAIKDWFRGV